ncbi:hypothetical protein HGRIS_011148 [Hohenbuehelia grisea]|uniref:Uncharacterized protein n=1 Tax=Hohenbuehelia grisea TaxID=104357 RepID=A0ABR3IYZ9_9AGAR
MLAGLSTQEPAESWDDDFEFHPPATKAGARNAKDGEPENWDDDFADSPSPPRSKAATSSSKAARSRRSIATPTRDAAEENWDAEFALSNSPIKQRASIASTLELGDDTDDEGEFGSGDREEDKTVTARSRRALAAPSRLAKATPPPPVPALPLPLRNSSFSNIPVVSAAPRSAPPIPLFLPPPHAPALSSEQPFPRSPSASVFSVPATVASSGGADSTTHLAPRRSTEDGDAGSSGRRVGNGVFSALPPSPQIHRERERRRLRKKSRSDRPSAAHSQPGTRSRSGSVGGQDGWAIAEDDGERVRSSSASGSASASTSGHEDEDTNLPQSTAPTGVTETLDKDAKSSVPLLTRLGSVGKRWSVRARRGKRASTAPEDVAALEEESQNSRNQDLPDGVFSAASGSGTRDIALNRPPAAPQAPHSYSQPRTHDYTDDDDDYDGAFAYDDPPYSRERQLQNDNDEILKQRMQLRNQDTIDHDQDHTPRAKMRPLLGGQDLPQAASSTSILNAPPSPSPARTRHPSNAMPMPMPSPHRKTSASASPASSPPSVTKQRSWFFRVASGSGQPSGASSSPGESDGNVGGDSPVSTPSKLVKRKSFGFVHLGRGHAASQAQNQTAGGSAESGTIFPETQTPAQFPSSGGGASPARQAAYAALGLGTPNGKGRLRTRSRTRSVSWSKAKTKNARGEESTSEAASASEAGEGDESDLGGRETARVADGDGSPGRNKEKEREGSRSFMGGMRRLSLVAGGKRPKIKPVQTHKRTKSGVPTPSAALTTPDGHAHTDDGHASTSPAMPQAKHPQHQRPDVEEDGDDAKTPAAPRPALLPPIELQPPSPPRHQPFQHPPRNLPGSMSLPAGLALVPPASSPASTTGSSLHSQQLYTIASEPSSAGPSPTSTLGSLTSSTPRSPMSPMGPELMTMAMTAPNVTGASLALRRAAGRPPGSPQAASLGRTTGGGAAGVTARGTASSTEVNGTATSNSGTIVPRRNSLGDLKIPARISQAQVGLRRDLGLVREFAANVESEFGFQVFLFYYPMQLPFLLLYDELTPYAGLRGLQDLYDTLVVQVQGILDTHAHAFAQQAQLAAQQQHQQHHQPRASSPLFNLGRRHRSNTTPPATISRPSPSHQVYKELASAFYTINSKYRLSLECAELLIELGGGSTGAASGATSPQSPPSTSVSAPAVPGSAAASDAKPVGRAVVRKKSRERAITLAGDESKPPTPTPGSASSPTESAPGPPTVTPSHPSAWRASTGRHDLSQRQLVLLKEMLSSPDPSSSGSVPAAVAALASAASDLSASGHGHDLDGNESFDHSHGPPRAAATPSPGPLQSPLLVNREWRWGDAMNSTVTLPSEEASASGSTSSPVKKRRMSRLGMRGIRDMLRALKKGGGGGTSSSYPGQHAQYVQASTVSLATESSVESRNQNRDGLPQYTNSHVNSPPVPGLPPPPTNASNANLNILGRRRAKTSIGPESTRVSHDTRSETPYNNSSFAAKSSPRRPSLASIFRLGQNRSHKATSAAATASSPDMSVGSVEGTPLPSSSSSSVGGRASRQSTNTSGDDEEDWDRLDGAGDLGTAARRLGVEGSSTIRGRGRSLYQQPSDSRQSSRPMTPKRTANSSQSSLLQRETSVPARTTRLSNVRENAGDDGSRTARIVRSSSKTKAAASPSRPPSRRSQMAEAVIAAGANAQDVVSGLPKTGSVRSMPPQHTFGLATTTVPGSGMPGFKLALTPENIGPLLENAKEVYKQLDGCIMEIKELLGRVESLSG